MGGNIKAANDAILSSNGNGEAVRSQSDCSHRSLMLSLQMHTL